MKGKIEKRLTRKKRIRKKVFGTAERPRMSVFRSHNHIYVQMIDDVEGKTILSASTKDKRFEAPEGDKKTVAKHVGLFVAALCKEANITAVIFDRNGYIYHGRVKALADGAREGGLNF